MIISTILENLATVVFCGFTVLFVLPTLLIRLFYVLPNMVRYAAKGKVDWKGIFRPIRTAVFWVATVAVLYVVCALLNNEAFLYIATSPAAIFCWVAGGISVALRLAFTTGSIKNYFYEDVYLRFATPQCRSEYREFIDFVDTLYINEARAMLLQKGLGYLERKALLNRVHLLEN